MAFRKDFIWGSASAAYQVEGAAYEDGKGLSMWDVFSKKEGFVKDGKNGDVATDAYHRYNEDIALMKEIGLQGYRFSVSWPRIFPDGTGTINPKGLDFYDRFVDGLLSAGIKPFMTMFHWDYPYELYKRGGWLNADSPKWFADYCEVVIKKLGDRVKHVITLNEPQCFVGLSVCEDYDPPAMVYPLCDQLLYHHNALKAHGMGVSAVKSVYSDINVGVSPCTTYRYPVTETPEDIEAARIASFDVTRNQWYWNIASWSDPVVLGKYPDKYIEMFEADMPKNYQDDMKIISPKMDFYGQNLYNGDLVRADGRGGYTMVQRGAGSPLTAGKWNITPESMYWSSRFMYERYKLPIYITENGLACADTVSLDGKVHDPGRIDFLQRYLISYKRAADEGIDVRGYFEWCFNDNFEWRKGYTERFGLVYVDFETQQRILKDSAYWYKKVIETNGESLTDIPFCGGKIL